MGCGKLVDQDGEKPIEGLLLMPWFDTLMKDSQHSTWPIYVSFSLNEFGTRSIPVNAQKVKDVLYVWLLEVLMDIDNGEFDVLY